MHSRLRHCLHAGGSRKPTFLNLHISSILAAFDFDSQPAAHVQVIGKGDIIEERLIAVLVDYPTEKERTTTLIERIFYEREYVRQVIQNAHLIKLFLDANHII